MKVCIVSGARPQFVKIAPIIREFAARDIEIYHIHTGQHYDHEMSASFFDALDIPVPDRNLEVGSGSHGTQTAAIVAKMEEALESSHPDLILVVGDTNSTIAAGLAAIKLNVPVVHLEAGMRSHDWFMPEEINRILVDRVSSLLITSTSEAVTNLQLEGISSSYIVKTGDVMVDSLYYARNQEIEMSIDVPAEYFLATLHRQENVDDESKLTEAVKLLADAPLPVILPLHPRTRQRLRDFDLYQFVHDSVNISLLPPLGYLEFIHLQDNATGIITDSGGVQKEAFILQTPCITLRDTTEWTQTLELGANRLTGIDYDKVLKVMQDIVDGTFAVSQEHPYGSGNAAVEIVDEIIIRYEAGQIAIQPNTDYHL